MERVNIVLLGLKNSHKGQLAVHWASESLKSSKNDPLPSSFSKKVEVEGQRYDVEIVDTHGVELASFLQNGDAFALVYSVTNRATFEGIPLLFNELQAIISSSPTHPLCPPPLCPSSGFASPIYLVANNVQKETKRVVSTEEGEALAAKYRVTYLETSSRTNLNVDKLFMGLVAKHHHANVGKPKKKSDSKRGISEKQKQKVEDKKVKEALRRSEKEDSLEREGIALFRSTLEKPKKNMKQANGYLYRELAVDSKEFLPFKSFFTKYLNGGKLVPNITSVKMIHMPCLFQTCTYERQLWQKRHAESPKVFKAETWRFSPDHVQRGQVHERYKARAKLYPWNNNPDSPSIVPVIHGTDLSIAQKICAEGFANTAMIDAGYYGSGIYFTSHALYALPYVQNRKNPCLVISMLSPGNVYPVIEKHNDPERTLLGSALKTGYQSHYVLTNRKGEISSMSGKNSEYDEFVIVQPYLALPVAVIELSANLDDLLAKWNRPTTRDQLAPQITIRKPVIPNPDAKRKPIAEWTIDELVDWVHLQCPDFDAEIFKKEQINGKAFLTFTLQELREDLHIPLGVAKILMAVKDELQKATNDADH